MGIDALAQNRVITNYFLNIIPTLAQLAAYIAIFHFAAKNVQNIDEFTTALGPLWQMTISLLKWFTFMYKRHEILRFVKRILAWNLEANEIELKLIVKENIVDIYFCRLYLFLVASTGYFALVKPLLNGIFFYFLENNFHVEPIVKATYPWNINNPLGYFLAAAWMYGGIHGLIYMSVGIDSLFSWITHNIIAQFNILEIRLKEAASEYNGHANPSSIANCIRYHCRILKIIDELNDVYGFVMFVQFTISCLQVCFLAFQLNRIKNFGDAAFEAGFLIAVALQLILYCRNGQRIRDKSLNVADCIYLNFKWQKLSKASTKLLLISMERAQKERNLSGIFFKVDLSLYLWVFKTAGSYLALLTTLDEK